MRIVLIDDDKDLSELTKRILEKEGFEVNSFNVATEGIHYAKEEVPELILMDMVMPEMSGEDAIKIIKHDSDLEHVPVLCLTALVSGVEEGLQMEGIKIDGKFYPALGKPFDIPVLLEAVDYFMR